MKRLRNLFFSTVLLTAFMALWTKAAASDNSFLLRFRDSVMVNDTVIFLSDIAEIRAGDVHAQSTLEKTIVGESAPAGFSRFVSVPELLTYTLKPRLGTGTVQTQGAERVRVTTDSRKVSVQDIADSITSYLQSKLAWAEDDCEISIEDPGVHRRLLNKEFSVHLTGLNNPYAKGSLRLTARILQGTKTTLLPVVCRVKVTVPVIAASTEIARDQAFNSSNTEIRKVDITGYSFDPYVRLDDLKDKAALRTISPGTIIHRSLVRGIPLVRKGDQLHLAFEKGSVRVSVLVQAREDGIVGDRIWVENSTTHKLVRVEVVSRDTARLLSQEAI